MKVKTALEMLNGLAELDGYFNGAGDRRTPYKLDGDTRLKIARARRVLRQVQEDYIEARNAALLEITDGLGELPSPAGPFENLAARATVRAQHLAFAARDRELLAGELNGIELGAVSVTALKLDENPIPPSVLDMLGPFLEGV
jgi:hypothetical protein